MEWIKMKENRDEPTTVEELIAEIKYINEQQFERFKKAIEEEHNLQGPINQKIIQPILRFNDKFENQKTWLKSMPNEKEFYTPNIKSTIQSLRQYLSIYITSFDIADQKVGQDLWNAFNSFKDSWEKKYELFATKVQAQQALLHRTASAPVLSKKLSRKDSLKALFRSRSAPTDSPKGGGKGGGFPTKKK